MSRISNYPDCTTGPTCWHTAKGAPIGAGIFSNNFGTYAVTSAGLGYAYDSVTGAWTSHPELGTVYELEMAGDGNLYGLVGTCLSTGHNFERWNHSTSSWTATGYCGKSFSADPQGGALTILIGADNLLYWSTNHGTSFVGLGGCNPMGALSVAVRSSNGGASGLGQLSVICIQNHGIYNGDIATGTSSSGQNVNYTQLSGAGFQVTVNNWGGMYVIGTDNAVYHWNTTTSAWDRLSNTYATSIADGGGGVNIWAVGGTSGSTNIWQFSEIGLQFARTYSGSVSCNVPPPYGQTLCAQFSHSATVQIQADGKTGTEPTQNWNGPGGWGVQSTVHANDLYDCFYDLTCEPFESSGSMSCSGGGSGSDGGGTWAFPCLTNLVPPKWAGWPKKSTVNVYIDNSYWNSAQLLAICEGITSWSVANLNSYSCHNASAPIATGNYIWVVYNPSFLDPLSGMPMGKNNNFGSGRAVQHSIITLGPFDNLQGAAAHEEGHNNFLDNCPACKLGGSLMGSQPTWSTFQPNTPTPCDLAWYAIWSL